MQSSQLELVLRAISFAARKHVGQVRNDGCTPYAAHTTRVMTIAAAHFGIDDAEVLAAAALHDTIEDCDCDYDELAEEFGERVARIVATLSKDKRLVEDERERVYFAALAAAPIEVKLCKLADLFDNLLDSRVTLSPAARRKAVARAEELLAIFDPLVPAESRHAIEAVRGVLAATKAIDA